MRIESFEYFYPEKPRLTSIKSPMFEKLSKDPQWIAEKKFNGSRLQFNVVCANNGDPQHFTFMNRHGLHLAYVPDDVMRKALQKLPWPAGYCLLDGELRHNKVVGVRHKIVFYDVFVWDGELLTDKDFLFRRNLLYKLLPYPNGPLSLPEWFNGDLYAAFKDVTKDPEIEGLVIKNINGKLNLGRNAGRDSAWMWKVRKESGRYRF